MDEDTSKPARNPLLREMVADKSYPCPYCKEDIRSGTTILGHYGIRWGHIGCVLACFEKKELILSKANADRRPPELEARSTGRTASGKPSPRPLFPQAWNNELEDMPPSCQHFPAQRLVVLELPEEMKLNQKVADEMTPLEAATAHQSIWDKYVAQWFRDYKAVHRELPYCPVHQAQKVYLQLKVVAPFGNANHRLRAVWWSCPGS